MDQDNSHRIDKIRQLLADNQNNYKTSNRIIVETINVLKPGLEGAQRKYLTQFYNSLLIFLCVRKQYLAKIYAVLALIIKSQNKHNA